MKRFIAPNMVTFAVVAAKYSGTIVEAALGLDVYRSGSGKTGVAAKHLAQALPARNSLLSNDSTDTYSSSATG